MVRFTKTNKLNELLTIVGFKNVVLLLGSSLFVANIVSFVRVCDSFINKKVFGAYLG